MNKLKAFYRKNAFLTDCTVRLFLTTVVIELMFHLMSFGTFSAELGRIILFSLVFSLTGAGICSLLPVKYGRLLAGFLCWFMAAYGMFQMGMKNMMGNYSSIRAGGDMLGRVIDYVIEFIRKLKPQFYLLLLAPLAGAVVTYRRKAPKKSGTAAVVLALILAVVLNFCSVMNVRAAGLEDLYDYPKYIEKALREFGLNRYLYRDVLSLGREDELTLSTITPTPSPTPVPETPVPEETAEPVEEVVIEEPHRVADDSEWIKAMDAEENETVRTIDQYLMQRNRSDYNEMTGLFKDKNLIYIMIEAFDYMALDETLTPTLVKMKNEGWDFTHHYTPKYSCTTGESEFISEVSLIPESTGCTPNDYADNALPNSIFQMFENEGYYTSAYHNWKDEFYDRRTLYKSSGCELYLNYDDQKYTLFKGWPSDKEMMELTIDQYIDKDRFMTLYVTSSTHFPYDADSELGNRYLSQINEVHPDYPMNVKRYISKAIELDKAMEYLLDQLEQHGKADDTVILFFADHHPLNTAWSTIADYSLEEGLDRREELNIDRTPFVIYAPWEEPAELDEINSTFDILPTTFNLFDVNYEPRIYFGTDYFGDKEKLIYFPNGDWISERGIYYMSSGSFVPFEGAEEADEEYISATTKEVQDLFSVSSMIYRSDYFADRGFVTKPVID